MRLDHLLSKEWMSKRCVLLLSRQCDDKTCWWRCARGRHPFPFRTRWLRPGRPKILCRRQYGKIGGRQHPYNKNKASGNLSLIRVQASPYKSGNHLLLGKPKALPVIRAGKSFPAGMADKARYVPWKLNTQTIPKRNPKHNRKIKRFWNCSRR